MTSAGTAEVLARRARGAVPPGAQAALRTAAVQVGVRTARARMLPNFLVVGAQRCGTTTMHRLLSGHPSVMSPLWHKGVNYFDVNFWRGPAWYRAHFPVAALARRRARPESAVTFETSGYYMYHPAAPARIAAELPDVRLVALLRDPRERAYSAWKHEFARGFETEPFERALDLEDERLEGEEERLVAEPGYQSLSHRHHSYIRRGLYARQVRALQEAVGPDQVRVIDANRFFAAPHEELAELLRWLELPPWRPPEVGQFNARPGQPLEPLVQARLASRFDQADAELTELLGRPPSWRG